MALSTTADVLDKTGTFTPTITLGGGTTGITYSDQTGNFRIEGDLIFIDLRILLTSKGTDTGTLFIKANLDAVYNFAGNSPVSFSFTSVSNGAEDRTVTCETVGSTVNFKVFETTNTSPSTQAQWTDASIQNNSEFNIAGWVRMA